MRDTGMNIFAPLRFDDLRLLDVVSIERKIFLGASAGFAAAALSAFGFFAAFGALGLVLLRPGLCGRWELAHSLPGRSSLGLRFCLRCLRLLRLGSSVFALGFSFDSAIVELNFAGLRILVPDHTDRLTRAFAGARIGRGALAADGQTAPMPNAAITIDRLQTLQIALHFAPQIAFDRQLVVRDRVNDFVELLRRQIFRAQIRIDVRLLEDPLRGARPDAVNIGQRRFDAFIGRNFNSQ